MIVHNYWHDHAPSPGEFFFMLLREFKFWCCEIIEQTKGRTVPLNAFYITYSTYRTRKTMSLAKLRSICT